MNKYLPLVLISLVMYQFGCKSKPAPQEIRVGEYLARGDIKILNDDTIYNGPIEFFDTAGRLMTLVNYQNNLRNGRFIDYYKNGKKDQELDYVQGKENGIVKFFDSAGKIDYEVNYYYGIEIGPNITFSGDTFKVYRFTNFEGLDLFRCQWDSSKQIIEKGNLLNYVTDYYMDDNNLKLSLFIYLINPPYEEINYKLYDKDVKNNDSTIIYTADYKKGAFEKVYLPPPKIGHKYLFDVGAFYLHENIRVNNIISEDEREMKMPHSREPLAGKERSK